jgi:transposase-like protein
MDNKAPERMRYPVDVIASAVSLFYEGLSLHKISRQLKLDYGVMPDHHSVYDWITRYTKKAVKTLEPIKPKVGDTWASDETVLKLKAGKKNIWLFDCLDETTRFLLASHLASSRFTRDAKILMERAENKADKVPKTVITDKLRSYLDAIEQTFGAETKHKRLSPFTIGTSTRSIERLHGTIKDRTKIMRGLTNRETAKLIMEGWGIHYNFFRPHQGLKGKTPSEVAGMDTPYKSWADIVEEK